METGKKYKLADKCITPGGRNMTRDEIEKFSSVGPIKWAYIDALLPKSFGNSEQLKGGEK